MPNKPLRRAFTCPACGLSDQVEKVSTVYMSAIADKRAPEIRQASQIPAQKLRSLSRILAPPSAGKSSATRPVHPDIVVIVFSCVLPIFLFGILKQQPVTLIPILFVLACLYGLYFYKRQAIIAKFERQQESRQQEQARVERGIKTWMQLYYCDRDQGVFLPGKGELVPLEQLHSYLLR
jgi:hypothetical protein